MDLKTGKIKTLREGYGFIKIDNEDKDAFFHLSELLSGTFKDLEVGQRCSFEVVETPKGLKAVRVDPKDQFSY